MQGIKVGNFQCIGHKRACAGAAPRANRATSVFGPVNEVAHDQKVARKSHLQNGVDLKLKAIDVGLPFLFTHNRVGVEVHKALFKPFKRGLPKIVISRHSHAINLWRWVLGQHGLAELQLEVASLGNL